MKEEGWVWLGTTRQIDSKAHVWVPFSNLPCGWVVEIEDSFIRVNCNYKDLGAGAGHCRANTILLWGKGGREDVLK